MPTPIPSSSFHISSRHLQVDVYFLSASVINIHNSAITVTDFVCASAVKMFRISIGSSLRCFISISVTRMFFSIRLFFQHFGEMLFFTRKGFLICYHSHGRDLVNGLHLFKTSYCFCFNLLLEYDSLLPRYINEFKHPCSCLRKQLFFLIFYIGIIY